jgi:hypothetical protein
MEIKGGSQPYLCRSAYRLFKVEFANDLHCKQEAHEGVITLKEVHPKAVAAMIQYLYTCDYGTANLGEDEAPILFHIIVSRVSDMYGLCHLADLAATKFEKLCEAEWRTPIFVQAVRKVYTVSSGQQQKLKDIVLSIAESHADELYKIDDSGFKEAAQSLPFGGDLSEKMAAKESLRYRCLGCDSEDTLFPPPRANEIVQCMGCKKRLFGRRFIFIGLGVDARSEREGVGSGRIEKKKPLVSARETKLKSSVASCLSAISPPRFEDPCCGKSKVLRRSRGLGEVVWSSVDLWNN